MCCPPAPFVTINGISIQKKVENGAEWLRSILRGKGQMRDMRDK